jgi:hypothetical protein
MQLFGSASLPTQDGWHRSELLPLHSHADAEGAIRSSKSDSRPNTPELVLSGCSRSYRDVCRCVAGPNPISVWLCF